MKKILHVISSPRHGESYSIKLGEAIVAKLLAEHPGSTVSTFDLVSMSFPHLEEAHIASFYTPTEALTSEGRLAIRHSDEAIKAIVDADFIVIGAPMYNFNIHSSLKAWLDHIVRSGVTFRVGAGGAEGLVTGKKVYLAVASGFVYSSGPMKAHDFVVPYLTWMLSFIGMTDISVVRVEGTSVPELKEGALDRAVASIAL